MTFRSGRGQTAPEMPTAETVGIEPDAVQAIKDLSPDGRPDPQKVVIAATDKSSPLHRYFEWDDGKAAHQHRLDQARRLIGSVRVLVEYEERTVMAPYYRHCPAEPKGYISHDRLKKDPVTAMAVLRYEFGRVASVLDRAINIAMAQKIKLDFQREAERLLGKLRSFSAPEEVEDD
jgi:hypothetical protein